ncbi:MAG: hypothetical protein Q4B63_06435 [Clostridium perfringens]|nr:hypothetical protein [Clostridium perfringens]
MEFNNNLKKEIKEELSGLKREINQEIYEDLEKVTNGVAEKIREEISYNNIKNQEKAEINKEILTMAHNNEVSEELNISVKKLIKEDRRLKRMFLVDVIACTAVCGAAIYLLHRKRK